MLSPDWKGNAGAGGLVPERKKNSPTTPELRYTLLHGFQLALGCVGVGLYVYKPHHTQIFHIFELFAVELFASALKQPESFIVSSL